MEAEQIIREYTRIDIKSPKPNERRHIFELRCRAERLGEELRQSMEGNRLMTRPATTPRTTGELDKY